MTEEEAKKKWCPKANIGDNTGGYNRRKDGGIPDAATCLGTRCMWWRWWAKPLQGQTLRDVTDPKTPNLASGYCGAAGEDHFA
jgi:hypothetical protein